MKVIHSVFLLLATPVLMPAQQPDDVTIANELRAYYESGKQPSWSEAIKRLTSVNANERDPAARYLVHLLSQAQQDEFSGKAPWQATPFWGSSGENPARNLREQVASELATSPASAATLKVVRWYLDWEKVSRFQATAIKVLKKFDDQAADEFCLSLLQPIHENSAVVLEALGHLARRKSAIPEAVLKACCHHYRPSIRTAARALNRERGGADPGAFDPDSAIRRPEIVKLLNDIDVLLDQRAPPTAQLVTVTTTITHEKDKFTETEVGWLVQDDGPSWVIHTPYGHRKAFHKEEAAENRRGDGTVRRSNWKPYNVAEEVQRVIEIRKKGDPEFELSERGGLTGQFQGHGAGVYEVSLAHWLYTARQFDLCAQVLLPALDSLYADRHLIEMTRHRVGEIAGHRMLAAFAGDRDFDEAQRLARALVQRYPGTRFHEDGVRLSKELPKRAGDFKTLKLPTAKEWAELKPTLTRKEQIEFLARRMRLLNCFQMSQPGGYSLSEQQYAEPCGLSRDAAWGLYRGKTPVINPYVELTGAREGVFPDEQKEPTKGLELTAADIPDLVPFLREDWHFLCVSFWRDFSPARSLSTTRPIFADIINGLARRDLSRVEDMSKMTGAEIDKHLESMIRWAEANAGKSEEQLIWENLEEEVRAGTPWGRLTNFNRLIEVKDRRVLPVLRRYLDSTESEYDLHALLYQCLAYDPPAFRDTARKFATHKSIDLRLAAGHILFAGGERHEARKVFDEILQHGNPSKLGESAFPRLIETLLKEGSDASKLTARRIFQNPKYTEIHQDWVRVSLVKQCAAAGIGDGYLSYIPLLDIKGNTIGTISYSDNTVVGELIAREIVEQLAPTDPEIIALKKKFPRASDQIPPLKQWLKARAEALATTRTIK
jgi:hypothetical protein